MYIDAPLQHLHDLEKELGGVKEEMDKRVTVDKAEDVADGMGRRRRLG
jgi:hypothetical protein